MTASVNMIEASFRASFQSVSADVNRQAQAAEKFVALHAEDAAPPVQGREMLKKLQSGLVQMEFLAAQTAPQEGLDKILDNLEKIESAANKLRALVQKSSV